MGLCPPRAKSANPPYFSSLKIKHPNALLVQCLETNRRKSLTQGCL